MGTADWYARKLREPSAPPPPAQVYLAPIQTPVAPIQTPRPAQPLPSGCPQCGSANYGAPTKSMAPRCFECGYGLSIQNSTQGLAAPNTGSATPAVQVPTAGYNPGQIVGRVE